MLEDVVEVGFAGGLENEFAERHAEERRPVDVKRDLEIDKVRGAIGADDDVTLFIHIEIDDAAIVNLAS